MCLRKGSISGGGRVFSSGERLSIRPKGGKEGDFCVVNRRGRKGDFSLHFGRCPRVLRKEEDLPVLKKPIELKQPRI